MFVFVYPIVEQFAHELVFTAILTVLGAVIMWPVKKAKKTWQENQDRLEKIANELAIQRMNCLTTLQEQGEKQINLLTKAVDTLDRIHVSQAEMSGYLKAKN